MSQATRQEVIQQTLTEIDEHSTVGSTLECSICREPLRSNQGLQQEVNQTGPHTEASYNVSISEEPTVSPPSLPKHPNTDNRTPETPVRLSCGHIFGKECITNWLHSSSNCPSCRTTVLAPPPANVISTTLLAWRHERSVMIQRVEQEWMGGPTSSLATILGRLAINFVQRETNLEEVPSQVMWTFCERLTLFPGNMIDGTLGGFLDDLELHPEEPQVQWGQPSREEIVHLVGLVRADLGACEEFGGGWRDGGEGR